MALSYNPDHFEDKWDPLMESYKQYVAKHTYSFDSEHTYPVGQQSTLNLPATSAPLIPATVRESFNQVSNNTRRFTNSDHDAFYQHERIAMLEEKLAMERKISGALATALKKAEEEVAKHNVETLQALYTEVYNENQELRKRIRDLEAQLHS